MDHPTEYNWDLEQGLYNEHEQAKAKKRNKVIIGTAVTVATSLIIYGSYHILF